MQFNLFQLVALASKNLFRNLRSGEFNLLIAALIVAVLSVSVVGLLNSRLSLALQHKSAQLAGGDLIISSPEPVSFELKQILIDQNLPWSEQVQVTTLFNYAEEFVLVNLIGVDAAYPLLGQVEISTASGAKQLLNQGPPAGEIWLEEQLAQRLGINLGQYLLLAEQQFLFSAYLEATPEASSGWSSFTPKAQVSLASLENNPLLGALTRAQWQVGIQVPAADLARIENLITAQLHTKQSLKSLHTSQPALARLVTEASSYLALIGLVSLLLASLALALASQRQQARLQRQAALLKCFGASNTYVMLLLGAQLLGVALLAGIVGAGLGFYAQHLLGSFLAGGLGLQLPAASWQPLVIAQLLALGMLGVFVLVPLRGQLSPLLALQGQTAPIKKLNWLSLSLAGLGYLALCWWLVGSWRLTGLAFVALISISAVLAGLSWLILRLLVATAPKLPWYARQALRRLDAARASSLMQLVSFTWVFIAILLVERSASQLLEQWQQHLPAQQPNYFALDIQPYEQQEFAEFLTANTANSSQLYPMVGARLSHLNSVPIMQAVAESARDDNSLHRELRLTFLADLPLENELVAGVWWPDVPNSTTQFIPISVETGLAQRLNLHLGDQLTFNVEGRELVTEIVSLRQVNWQNMQPNFFVIFPPSSLTEFTPNYLASFVIPEPATAFIRQVNQQFPGVLLLDMRSLIKQLQNLLEQLSRVVISLLVLLVGASLLVSWALLATSQDARIQEQALLRIFGASRASLRKRQALEFIVLGAVAGGLASILSELLYSLVARWLLNLSWQPAWTTLWLMPVLSAILLVSLAYLVLRKSLQAPVMASLK